MMDTRVHITRKIGGMNWTGEITATEVTYQRNGISGEGFHVVKFGYVGEMPPVTLIGVVFDAPKTIAILDPLDLANHWRGDNFETALREIIEESGK